MDLVGKISTGRFKFCLSPQDERSPEVLSTLQNIQILSSWLLVYKLKHRFPFNNHLQKICFSYFTVLCMFICFLLPVLFILGETSPAAQKRLWLTFLDVCEGDLSGSPFKNFH